MLLMLLTLLARAGDLVVDAALPTELRASSDTLVQTLAPARVRLTGLKDGPLMLDVVAGGRSRQVQVEVPQQGAVGLKVTASGATVEAATTPATPPLVELRVVSGDRFAVLLDGARLLTLTARTPVILEGLTAGEHALEIRSADLLTIWARGTLDLRAEDRVRIGAAEGRRLDVFGRTGVWAPSAETTPALPPGG